MAKRNIKRIINSMPTSDGAGVRLRRSLGQNSITRLDPFLMLDEFSSEEASDYIAGFPDHPHRGFETVTYMLDGHMLHQDHMGNRGDLLPGDVQWMTAGRGIIHSEMPQQNEGRMRGFQLWINLPAAEKMKPAAYCDIPAASIPQRTLANGVTVRLIAGELPLDGETVRGPIFGLSTEPLYADVTLPAGTQLAIPVAPGHNAFTYVFEGEAALVGDDGNRRIEQHSAAILEDGDNVVLAGGPEGGRLLLLAGKPIGEPVVQYGPFVMNTVVEIEQALQDYRNGTLASPAA